MSPPGEDLNVDQLFDLLHRKLQDEQCLDDDGEQSTVAPERLHKRLEDAARILSLVRLRANATLPIHQLPVEILKYIFEMTQDYLDNLFPPMMNNELDGLAGWLVVTKVCHHWRQLALEIPSLWRNVVLSSRTQDQNYMREWFIRRSRPHRIHLSQMIKRPDFGESRHPENLASLKRSLLENSDRLEALHISSALHLGNSVWDLLDGPFPVLTSLHLDLSIINDGPSHNDAELPQILAGGVPNLKRLSLSHSSSWPRNVSTFSELTHLSLRDVYFPPHITDFLATLEGCPLLEVICLHNASPRHYPTYPAPSNTITLPFLAAISISNGNPSIESQCNLLQYLTLPAKTSVMISAKSMFDSEVQLKSMLPQLDILEQVTILDIRSTGDECLLIDDQSVFVDTSKALVPISDIFPNIRELRLSRRLPSLERLARSFLVQYSTLSVITLCSPMNYIPLMNVLDVTISQAAVCPNLSRLIVKDMGQATTLAPASRKRVLQYQQSRVTTIERAHLPSYQLIVEPNEGTRSYVTKALRRSLPPREEELQLEI